MSNPYRGLISAIGESFKDGYGDESLVRELEKAIRLADEWDKQEADRQAVAESARRSNARDPYGVGQGSGATLGQPKCEGEGCTVSGGRKRRSRKSRKYRR